MVKTFFKLLRVHQYAKNLFIFLPLFFGLKLFNFHMFLITCLTFLLFSLCASSIYIINDIFDIEYYKRHSLKKDRPIASGCVSVKQGIIISLVLAIFSLLGAFFLKKMLVTFLVFYIILNLLYSFKLKHIAIVDVTLISVGFVIRVLCGGIVVSIPISHWIIIMTFLTALFFAFSKRYSDLACNGKELCSCIDSYNINFLSQILVFLSSIIFVSYLLYTLSPETLLNTKSDYFYITSLFVLLGFLRFLQILFIEKNIGDLSRKIFSDKFLLLTIIMWTISAGLILYLR